MDAASRALDQSQHLVPQSASGDLNRPVAYFCAEFGLHNSVPIYSGGLGILAGDHLKASSDLGVPLVGVGLFYIKGYFDQRLRIDGWQEDSDVLFDIETTPLERMIGPTGERWLYLTVRTFDRPVHVGAWRMQVGRVPVYLLDTNLEQNDPADRDLSGKLVRRRTRHAAPPGVDPRRRRRARASRGRNRAVGLACQRGARRLHAGGAAARADHPGRALRGCGGRGPKPQRLHDPHPGPGRPRPVRHGPGPRLRRPSLGGAAVFLRRIPPDRRADGGPRPLFHMTTTAIRLSARVNGVARKHGEVSRELWRTLWPQLRPEKCPSGMSPMACTSQPGWPAGCSGCWISISAMGWIELCDTPGFWDEVLALDDVELWQLHLEMKRGLLTYIREDARRRWADHWKEAAHVVGAGTLISPDALVIGFARRFATYKRAAMLFSDFERLHDLLVNPWRPVQIIFAGKAHPGGRHRARKCCRRSTPSRAIPDSRAGWHSSRTTRCIWPTAWCRGSTSGSTFPGCRSRPAAPAA